MGIRKPDISLRKRPPLILHLSTARSWRGGEQQMAYLIGSLNNSNLEQLVVCAKGSATESYCRSNRIPHVALRKIFSLNPVFALRLKQICRRVEVSLIHCHDAHAHTFAVLAASLFGNDCPLVVSRRVDFPIGKSWFSEFKYNHSRVQAILCVSDKIREIMTGKIRRPSVLHTVYSGIDIQRFLPLSQEKTLRREYRVPDEHAVIANIAALAPHKDYFTFVETAALLIKNGVKATFFIIGEGPLREEIRRYITEKRMEEHIVMTGFRKDVPALLPGVDIFLITSSTEGLGTSILDAFACHVPVVATAAGGIPELVKDGETGLLAPVRSPARLAEKVQMLLDDPVLGKRLTDGAAMHLQNFTYEATARRTQDIYFQVLLF